MGTIEQILDDLESISRDLADLDYEDDSEANRQAWLDMIDRIDKNRAECAVWIEMPNIVRKLQDKPLGR